MSNKKIVTKNYALHEFKIVGLILIIYALFVLYIPLGLKYLFLLNSENINTIFIYSFICLVLGTLLPFSFLRIYCKEKVSDLVSNPNIEFKEKLINFIVFFAISICVIYVNTIIGDLINVEGRLISDIGIIFNSNYIKNYLYLVSFIVISPILEEYAFRGVLLSCLSRYGKYFAIFATSIVYALAHGYFTDMIPSFIMGFILSKMALRYKSIRPTIFIHIVFNISLCLLSIIPEDYVFYVAIVIVAILVWALILVLKKKYKIVGVNKSSSNNKVTLMFVSTYTVLIALILFVLYTVLIWFI